MITNDVWGVGPAGVGSRHAAAAAAKAAPHRRRAAAADTSVDRGPS